MTNETPFTPPAAPTSTDQLRANLAEAERFIAETAAAARNKAELPPATPATREDISDHPDVSGLNPADRHRILEAHFRDTMDVLAKEQRPSGPGAAVQSPGGVDQKYVEGLKAARVAQGAKPSPAFNRVFEIELSQALNGRQRSESLDSYLTRTGTVWSAEQRAEFSRDAAAARAERIQASIAPEDRAIGLVHQSEIPEPDRHGYSLALAGNAPIDPAVAGMLLNMARSLGLSQAHVDSALRAELKRAGR